MGYACPVCEIPQRDGEHLAHHLAFTAMLHGEDHEAWLDDHVEDWGEREPEALAADVTPHAEDAEYHEVFEDTAHDHGRPDVGHQHGQGSRGHNIDARGEDVDSETAAVLEEARELTREMLSEGDDDNDGEDAAAADTDAADTDAAQDDEPDPAA